MLSVTAMEKIARLLQEEGVRVVGCTFVDNAGVTRVKGVPIDRLCSAARKGVGISYTFAVFGVNDHITQSPGYDTPSGDMRLIPDLEAAVALGTDPGWAWAPVDPDGPGGQPHARVPTEFPQKDG